MLYCTKILVLHIISIENWKVQKSFYIVILTWWNHWDIDVIKLLLVEKLELKKVTEYK